MKNYVILALLLAMVVLSVMWYYQRRELSRLALNQSALLDTLYTYKTKDSLSAASVKTLALTISELRDFRAQDAKTIRELGINLRRVQNLSKIAATSHYNISVAKPSGDSIWNYRSEWIELNAKKTNDTLSTDIVLYDTIIQVLHRVPRFRFLGINFGTKGVRQEIVCRNPYMKITAAEYLDIVR